MNCLLSCDHTCSMGFRSGELGGHDKTLKTPFQPGANALGGMFRIVVMLKDY